MKELSITDLARILNARVIGSQSAGQTCLAVSTDSRTVQPGDCFFAITGPNFDGHNFLADAFAKGASCAVVSKDITPDKFPGKTVLRVNNTVEALGRLAASYRKNCNFKVVAITGSVGKTTTRQIAYHVLSKRFKPFQSLKNFNNFIGLPLSILAASPEHQILVLELATNKPGEIEYLSRIASPDIALITNVHPVHLAGLGSIEKIAEEKLSIVKGLRPDGVLILNADFPSLLASASLVEAGLDSARKAKLSFKTFACSTSADFSAQNIYVGPFSSSFAIDDVTVEIPLPGRGNVENTLAAWAICSSLGTSIRDFADALKTISPVSMRTEMLQIGSLTVISDCYNANPASMNNALDILATLAKKEEHRAVFICGDMAELGSQAEKFHIVLGRHIANAGVSLLITLGNLAALAADAAKRKNPVLQTRCFIDPAELCNNLHQLIRDSDIILVKGSRINKLEMVVEKLKELHNIK
jgi:UDP-N-acetylmuramoyl-tripeptide--D-alanyl-D-alanine ligase